MLNKLNNIALYFFSFSIVFESWDPFGLKGIFSITKMIGFIYIFSSLPFIYLRLFSRETKWLLILLLVFFFFYTFSTISNFQGQANIISLMNISLLLNIITFILVTNHMLEKPETVDNVLLAFLSGVVLMWLLFRLGIGIGIEGEGQTRRLSLFGENPNMIGNKAVIAFTIVLYFLFVAKKGSRRRLMSRIFLLVLVLILFSLVMATGSRGAFIAFFISSLFVLYVLEVRRIYKIILVVFTVLISIYIWNQIMYGESIMQRRLMEIVEERSYGHRGELLEYGLVTFTKNPIFGVGSIYKPSESEFRDPHNVFVYVLLTSGLMGFVPFVFFNYIILMRGYRTYKHKNNILCLILFFSLVLIMAKSGGFISKKLLWITYAFISGAAISNNITNISQEN